MDLALIVKFIGYTFAFWIACTLYETFSKIFVSLWIGEKAANPELHKALGAIDVLQREIDQKDELIEDLSVGGADNLIKTLQQELLDKEDEIKKLKARPTRITYERDPNGGAFAMRRKAKGDLQKKMNEDLQKRFTKLAWEYQYLLGVNRTLISQMKGSDIEEIEECREAMARADRNIEATEKSSSALIDLPNGDEGKMFIDLPNGDEGKMFIDLPRDNYNYWKRE